MVLAEQQKSRKFRRFMFYTGCTLLFFITVVGLLYGLRPMLLPLVLGSFLAYICKPLVTFRGSPVKKYMRAGGIILALAATIYWGAKFVRDSLPNEKEKLVLKVRLAFRAKERYTDLMGLANGGKGNLAYKFVGTDLDPLVAKAEESLKLSDDEKKLFLMYVEGYKGEEPIAEKYYEYFLSNNKAQKADIDKMKQTSSASVSAAGGEGSGDGANLAEKIHMLTTWLIFPLSFLFILLDKGQMVHFFMRLVPNRYFELIYSVVENVDEALGKYIRGTLIECLLVGLSLMVGFYVSGIELKISIMIGLIGGITNAIPFVGTFIACIVGAAYSLIAEDVHSILPFINANNLMVAVLVVVMITHLLDNAVFQPLVVGHAVNIHPLVVIIGVFGGSMMFGFAGLIFAIPTIVVTKVVIETFYTGVKAYRII